MTVARERAHGSVPRVVLSPPVKLGESFTLFRGPDGQELIARGMARFRDGNRWLVNCRVFTLTGAELPKWKGSAVSVGCTLLAPAAFESWGITDPIPVTLSFSAAKNA